MKQKMLSIALCAGFALSFGYSLADDAEQGSTKSSWDPNFYATFGFVSWSNYSDASRAEVDEAFKMLVSTPLPDLEVGGTTRLEGGVGMRPTERLSIEITLADLPKADLSFRGNLAGTEADLVSESFGWRARLAAEYAFPVSANGMKLTTQVGISHAEVKGVVYRAADSSDPDSEDVVIVREKQRLQDPFVGVGMRIPLTGMVDGLEMSLMFTKVLSDEDSVNQSLGAQLIYNFD